MIELSRLTVLLLGELMLGLLLLSGVLIALGIFKKGKERKAAQILVAKIQTDKKMRKERLQKRLSNDFRYEGETLNQAVHDLTQAEMNLYQNIISGFLKRDVVAFEQIDIDRCQPWKVKRRLVVRSRRRPLAAYPSCLAPEGMQRRHPKRR